jgi:hypothetical protein
MNDESGQQSRAGDVIISWGITERINGIPQTHVLMISGELADSALLSRSRDRNLGPQLMFPCSNGITLLYRSLAHRL